MEDSAPQEDKSKTRRVHYDTKLDVRLPRETAESLSTMADYDHTSKSSLARVFIMSEVAVKKKDPDYRKYLKNLRL